MSLYWKGKAQLLPKDEIFTDVAMFPKLLAQAGVSYHGSSEVTSIDAAVCRALMPMVIPFYVPAQTVVIPQGTRRKCAADALHSAVPTLCCVSAGTADAGLGYGWRCKQLSFAQGLFELITWSLGEALSYLSSLLKLWSGMVVKHQKLQTGEVLQLEFFLMNTNCPSLNKPCAMRPANTPQPLKGKISVTPTSPVQPA